jgi:hypothetical protein
LRLVAVAPGAKLGQARLRVGIDNRFERRFHSGRGSYRVQASLGVIAVRLQVLHDEGLQGRQLFRR